MAGGGAVVVFWATLASGGCATVARGSSTDGVFVDSSPPGATIFVNRELAGTTPRLVPMPRDHTIEIRCSLAGYRDAVESVRREVAPAAGFDNPVFAVVDELTGAAYPLAERKIFVELTPMTSTSGPSK
jgi:hypothetical protein